jgi:hypothetical protein
MLLFTTTGTGCLVRTVRREKRARGAATEAVGITTLSRDLPRSLAEPAHTVQPCTWRLFSVARLPSIPAF